MNERDKTDDGRWGLYHKMGQQGPLGPCAPDCGRCASLPEGKRSTPTEFGKKEDTMTDDKDFDAKIEEAIDAINKLVADSDPDSVELADVFKRAMSGAKVIAGHAERAAILVKAAFIVLHYDEYKRFVEAEGMPIVNAMLDDARAEALAKAKARGGADPRALDQHIDAIREAATGLMLPDAESKAKVEEWYRVGLVLLSKKHGVN